MVVVGKAPRADFEVNLWRVGVGHSTNEFLDTAAKVLCEPIDDESVGGEQAQHAVFFDGLQRAHPRIELLLGNLRLQQPQTTVPQRRFHERNSATLGEENGFGRKGVEVYNGDLLIARPRARMWRASCVDSTGVAAYPCRLFALSQSPTDQTNADTRR